MWFRSWLDVLGIGSQPRRSRPGRRPANRSRQMARRLQVEGLEDRRLLTFLPAVDFPVGTSPLAVVAADFNNDGHLDVATANSGGVSVLPGDGAGGFGAAIGAVEGYYPDYFMASLAVADFNNDGNLDLATSDYGHTYENGQFSFGWWGVGVLLGNGDGTFEQVPQQFLQSYGVPLSVVVGDFNNDGNSDLQIFEEYDSFGYFYRWLGDGQGGFTTRGTGTLSQGWYGQAAGDLNGDGNLDVVGNGITLLGTGNGSTVFEGEPHFYGHGLGNVGVAIGEFTSDGIPDLVTTGEGVGIHSGRGDGHFEEPNTYGNNWHTGIAVADFNGDGQLDAVTSDPYSETVSEFFGNGDGGLAYAGAYSAGSLPTAVAVGDFNGDGRPDVATANGGSNTVSVLLNAADNNAPWLRIHDMTLTEGNIGTTLAHFVVTLSTASTETITVAYATSDGTATAGSDYQAASGILTFAPGETSKTISIVVSGDREREYTDESLFVNLSGASGASIADGQGVGTIVDDEPQFSIVGGTVVEENSGTKNLTFTVTMSAPYDVPTTVTYATENGTATSASGDFQSKTGTLTFNPGDPLTQSITVLVNGDRLHESNETFAVNLGGGGYAIGTIIDDDPLINISISDVSKKEGKKSQTTLYTFTVTLSAASDQPVTMSYRTVNGTATTGDGDYTAKTGTLTFAPGETTKTITIEVKGDSKKESNETFYLDLFGQSSNALFTKNRGIGTILNDD